MQSTLSLTDKRRTSRYKRTPRVGPYLSLLPFTDLTLYKTDIALRQQALIAGPKGVLIKVDFH